MIQRVILWVTASDEMQMGESVSGAMFFIAVVGVIFGRVSPSNRLGDTGCLGNEEACSREAKSDTITVSSTDLPM